MKDTKPGTLIDATAQRDAIHVAIAPVVAAERLTPGTHVGIRADGRASSRTDNPIGIVDPFLRQCVFEGERFWLFLYPDSITSLRHNWTHPAFEDQKPAERQAPNIEASKKWLREYALRTSPYCRTEDAAYKHLLDHITEGSLHYYGTELGGMADVEDPSLLWYHLGVVLGRPIDPESLSFSCSC